MGYSKEIKEIFSHVNKIKSEFEKMDPLKLSTINNKQEIDDNLNPKQETIMVLDGHSPSRKIKDDVEEIQKHNTKLEEKNLPIRKLNKDIEIKDSLIKKYTFEIERLRYDLLNKNEQCVSSLEKLKNSKNKIQEKNKELSLFKNELRDKEKTVNSLNQKIMTLTDESLKKDKILEEKSQLIKKLNQDINLKDSLIDQHTIKVENLKSQLIDKMEKYVSSVKKLKNLKIELQDKEKTVNSLNQKIMTLTDESLEKDRKIEILNKRNNRDKKRISTKTTKIKELKKQLKCLEDSNVKPESNPQIQEKQMMEILDVNDDDLVEKKHVSVKKPLESLEKNITDVESKSKLIQEINQMSLSERMNKFQQEVNALNFPDLSNGVCDICSEEINLEKNLSGLVVAGDFFACEKCCRKSSKHELSNWTKSKMNKTSDVRSIGLWLTQQKNKQNEIRGNIKF